MFPGGVATRGNLQTECGRFGYAPEKAASVVDEMRSFVSDRRYATCRGASVSPDDCERIRSAFVYPGFQWGEEAENDDMPSDESLPTP